MQQKLSTLQDVSDTYDWFQQMRDTQPVWLDESSGCWHVFRYEDVNTIITDYHNYSSERPGLGRVQEKEAVAVGAGDAHEELPRRRGFGRSLIGMDPPQHRQYRNLVSPSFTPKALSRLSGRIEQITQELLDEVRPLGHADFVTSIAYPLPTIVISELLGVPTSDRPLFNRWADGLLNRQLNDAEFFKPGERERNSPEMKRITDLFDEMSDYFEDMLNERRRNPREDMMSELLAAEVDGEHLSTEDVISFCILLLLAGHVTTTNLLSQSIRCFDEHPEALEQLRRQPELMPGAIEEVLRYASPVWRLIRITNVPVTIAGVTIPKKEPIFTWLASANRDERQFANPAQFDITRNPNRHIAFGHGIHFCIGAPLSRLETAIALPMLVSQLPDLHIVKDQDFELFQGRALFGFRHLPITFTPA